MEEHHNGDSVGHHELLVIAEVGRTASFPPLSGSGGQQIGGRGMERLVNRFPLWSKSSPLGVDRKQLYLRKNDGVCISNRILGLKLAPLILATRPGRANLDPESGNLWVDLDSVVVHDGMTEASHGVPDQEKLHRGKTRRTRWACPCCPEIVGVPPAPFDNDPRFGVSDDIPGV